MVKYKLNDTDNAPQSNHYINWLNISRTENSKYWIYNQKLMDNNRPSPVVIRVILKYITTKNIATMNEVTKTLKVYKQEKLFDEKIKL